MCGITAVLALARQSNHHSNGSSDRSLEEQIDESLKIVKHRGPDAEGRWVSPDRKAALGHVRLSIIDLSPAGNQPFHDNKGDIHAVVNGELYGHEEYRKQLGHEYDFQGNSDCEIVIALYKHYGISFLSHLRGEFALVLYDAKRKLFFAAKDRYGIKSLYYTVLNGRLLIATEMKQFLAFGWKPEWNVQAIRDNGWRHDERTMFKDVFKVLPGHFLISKDFQPFRLKDYWDMEYPNKHIKEPRTEEEMVAGVRERLVEAVRLRLRADVPVGIYLSGGLDSSSVAGIVAHLIEERGQQLGNDASKNASSLTCFTVGFDKDSGADESDIAKRTADWLGAKFVLCDMNEEAVAAKFEDTAWFCETVAPDANGPGRMAMAEAAKQRGIKVILTGEGSDEHFAGYLTLRSDAVREPDYSWPASDFPAEERQKVLAEAEETGNFMSWAKFGPTPPESTMRMINQSAMTKQLSVFVPLSFSSWTEDGADINQETVITESHSGRVLDAMQHRWHPLNTGMYLWTKSAFANILLRYIGDNVDMVHHVESRTPFLDHHLTSYANGLPPALKMKYDPKTAEWSEKYVLKEAMRPYVTDEIYRRRKHPFLGPVRFARDGPLHRLMNSIITRENVEALGFLDWERTSSAVHRGFVERDTSAVKESFAVAQFITLGKRFGVKTARPEGEEGVNGHVNGHVNGDANKAVNGDANGH